MEELQFHIKCPQTEDKEIKLEIKKGIISNEEDNSGSQSAKYLRIHNKWKKRKIEQNPASSALRAPQIAKYKVDR